MVSASALITNIHSSVSKPANNPVSLLSSCTCIAEDKFNVARVQGPLKAGVPLDVAQMTGSRPQLCLFKTYFAGPILTAIGMIITHIAIMVLTTVHISSLDIVFSITNTAFFRHFAESVVLSVLCKEGDSLL